MATSLIRNRGANLARAAGAVELAAGSSSFQSSPTVVSWDPEVGLCIDPYSGPKGEGLFLPGFSGTIGHVTVEMSQESISWLPRP